MNTGLFIALGFIFITTTTIKAAGPEVASPHLGSIAQQEKAAAWNRTHKLLLPLDWNAQRPFSEIEETAYVVTNAEDDYEMADLRQAIAKNLPEGVTLILYVTKPSMAANLKETLGGYLREDQLKFLAVPDTGDPLWARDSLPFPVYLNVQSPSFGLVGSIYPQNFDPNSHFAEALSWPLERTKQYFRGGNLLFDLKGNCFAENSNEVRAMVNPTAFFKGHFGCSTVTLLDPAGGIGDIDERIKFLAGNVALTDNEGYANILKGRGYTVYAIPQTGANRETYMNTLYVNGTIFVPQMGIKSDPEALRAYRNLGMKAVGVYTKKMANTGLGNIHCVTMNYPKGTFTPSKTQPEFVEFAR